MSLRLDHWCGRWSWQRDDTCQLYLPLLWSNLRFVGPIYEFLRYCMFLGLLNVEAMVETVVLCKQRCLQWGRFQLPSGVLCNVSLFCFGETFLIPKEGKVYRKQNLDRGTASSFEESSPHLCLSIICVAQAMMPPLCFPIHTIHILQLWSILIFL